MRKINGTLRYNVDYYKFNLVVVFFVFVLVIMMVMEFIVLIEGVSM